MSRIALPNLRIGGLRQFSFGDVIYDRANLYPNLDLDFATNKNLTDNVTGKTSLVSFSRSAASSPGTYVGSDGLIKTAAVNLALYSEQFDNAVWAKGRSKINANAEIAPDGKQTADKWVEDGTASQTHFITSAIRPSGITTFSVFAKQGERKWLGLSMTSSVSQPYAFFDLENGVVGLTGSASGTIQTLADIENVGNGWFRCVVTWGVAVSGYVNVFGTPNNGVFSWSGDGTSGIYLWGAQLQEGTTPTAYIHTTSQTLAAPRFDHDPTTGESLGLLVEEQRTNLFLNSNTLATQTITTTAAAHTLSFYGTGTVVLSGTHTATVVGTGAYPARTTLTFNPTAGSLTATVTGTVEFAQLEAGAFPTSYIPTEGSAQTRYADVAAVQDEDFATTNLLAYSESFTSWGDTNISRDSTTETAPDGQATALQISASSANGTVIYPAAMGTSAERVFSIYMRRVTGTGDIQYTLNNGSNWTTQAITSSWQRYIFPKSTAAQQPGIRIVTSGDAIEIWGASLTATEYPVAYTTTRNLLADSQDFERSPWATSGGTTLTNDAAIAPDGTPTADKFTSSASGGLVKSHVFLAGTYTVSVWMKADSSQSVDFGIYGPTYNDTASVTTEWQRFSATFTIPAGTRYPQIQFPAGSTVYAWGFQIEPGTTATDYVRTVDVVGKDYQWYEPTEGTVFVEADTVGTALQQTIVAFSTSATSTTSRTFETNFRSNGDGSVLYTVSPLTLYQTAMTTQYQGKIAVAEKYNSARSAFDGSLSTAVSSFTMPAPIGIMNIGRFTSTNNILNGHIKRIIYFPRRTKDSNLVLMTE